jgi:ribose 5-phosphate isomerase
LREARAAAANAEEEAADRAGAAGTGSTVEVAIESLGVQEAWS